LQATQLSASKLCKFNIQPLGTEYFPTLAPDLIRFAGHAAFCGSIFDKVFRGFDTGFEIIIFFLNVCPCFCSFVRLTVTDKRAARIFNILKQMMDLPVYRFLTFSMLRYNQNNEQNNAILKFPTMHILYPFSARLKVTSIGL
jgi:hypothetical protein